MPKEWSLGGWHNVIYHLGVFSASAEAFDFSISAALRFAVLADTSGRLEPDCFYSIDDFVCFGWREDGFECRIIFNEVEKAGIFQVIDGKKYNRVIYDKGFDGNFKYGNGLPVYGDGCVLPQRI